ncbi:MAG TPA: phosphoenolpyruvate mutase [Gammaproteobacteria bacterium]|nr:phosphoenolpyruvate mutase [Gammaproteobacteria bacterium]HJP43136.1 phosphoenolpyruvate mutase [Gammaproteobacteria bacterium]
MGYTTIANKTSQFRSLLNGPKLEFLLEAHNGISAKIAEESGFKGLWAGGLAIAAQYGVRDSNEASWTQVLEVLEFMSDATSIPIMLDGDTGYGNFNNVRRLVQKLEQRGIAAVCIEDKLYPKTNSFIDGNKQELANIDEFCSRIKAGKDAQKDDEFSIITRVEAFIAGWGLDEAIKRAEAYRQAGSDGILIHSSKSEPSEIIAFKNEWGDRLPVIIVPTKYYSTPTEIFSQVGISIAIWANHMIRSSIESMQQTAASIIQKKSVVALEDKIASVSEIFRLQGVSELLEAEEMYLPKKQKATSAIILAASRGSAMGSLTEERPKAMLKVKERPILRHIVDVYNSHGIKNITVVRGFQKDAIDLPQLSYADNDNFSKTDELVSFEKALLEVDLVQDLFVSFGDVLFKPYLLQLMDDFQDEVVIVVDTQWQDSVNKERAADYVHCSEPHSRDSYSHEIFLKDSKEDMDPDMIHGEWMGVVKFSNKMIPTLKQAMQKLKMSSDFDLAKFHDLFSFLVSEGHNIRIVYTTGHWLDIDTVEDLLEAGNFL